MYVGRPEFMTESIPVESCVTVIGFPAEIAVRECIVGQQPEMVTGAEGERSC